MKWLIRQGSVHGLHCMLCQAKNDTNLVHVCQLRSSHSACRLSVIEGGERLLTIMSPHGTLLGYILDLGLSDIVVTVTQEQEPIKNFDWGRCQLTVCFARLVSFYGAG